MRELAERLYFFASLALGRLLRAGKYSSTTTGVGCEVRKRRRFYAPVVVPASGPIFRLLDTGMRVLSRRGWSERERRIYDALHRPPVRSEGATLVLPLLPGKTLAAVLDDAGLAETTRHRAIELAVRALAELHQAGWTHGDAMAENVLVDLEGEAAHWIDFETVHDARRPPDWCRADDLRALIATCLLRTPIERMPQTLAVLVDAYPDDGVRQRVAERFTPIVQRPLPFHLGQAPLPWPRFRAIAALLDARSSHAGGD